MCDTIKKMGKDLEAAGQMPGPALTKDPDGYPFVHDVIHRMNGEKFTFGSALADETFDEDPELIREEMMRLQNIQEEKSRQETAAQYPTAAMAYPAVAYPAMAPPPMFPPTIAQPEQAGRVHDPNEELSPSNFPYYRDQTNDELFSPESLNPASMNMTFPTIPENSNYLQQFPRFNQTNPGYDWNVNLSVEDTFQQEVGLRDLLCNVSRLM